jgi:SAM-dependent methyltransferase
MIHHADGSPVDVERFLRETRFAGYQRITLPTGQVIPGTDRLPMANLIYPADLAGRSVLDVGCNYGFFLHEAIRRGAGRAVGIEADPERFEIARTLGGFWGDKIGIHQGLVEDVDLDEQFDVVILLNVLHHVKDPIEVIRKVRSLCRGTLIVEFRQPHDPQFVGETFHGSASRRSRRGPLIRRIVNRVESACTARLMEWATKRASIVGVGSVEYHRSYFFSQAAFRNIFQVHNAMFRDITFRPSLTRGQTIAFCDCS